MSDQQFESELENAPMSSNNAEQGVESDALIDVTELFKKSWKIYKNKFPTFFKILILPMLLTILFVIACSALYVLFFVSKSSSIGTVLLIIASVLCVAFALFMMVFQGWAQLSVLYVIKDNEEKIGVKEAYKRSKSKIFSFFLVCFLFGLTLAAGFILFIIPAVIFYIWFVFSIFILICENIEGIKGLSKSKEYVKGKWFKVFLRIIPPLVITAIVYSILVSIVNNMGVGSDTSGNIGTLICSLIVMPFYNIYLYLLYDNLKKIKK